MPTTSDGQGSYNLACGQSRYDVAHAASGIPPATHKAQPPYSLLHSHKLQVGLLDNRELQTPECVRHGLLAEASRTGARSTHSSARPATKHDTRSTTPWVRGLCRLSSGHLGGGDHLISRDRSYKGCTFRTRVKPTTFESAPYSLALTPTTSAISLTAAIAPKLACRTPGQ